MTTIKLFTDDEYYLCRVMGSGKGTISKRGRKYVNWFMVKYKDKKSQGYIPCTRPIYVPKELIGKKIRLKVEFLDDEMQIDEDDLK